MLEKRIAGLRQEDLKSGQVQTYQVSEGDIGDYIAAGMQSSFKVSPLVGEYPAVRRIKSMDGTRGEPIIVTRKVNPGFIAVAIMRPDNESSHDRFRVALAALKERRLQSRQ